MIYSYEIIFYYREFQSFKTPCINYIITLRDFYGIHCVCLCMCIQISSLYYSSTSIKVQKVLGRISPCYTLVVTADAASVLCILKQSKTATNLRFDAFGKDLTQNFYNV
ncbi:unnamed protein product [Orchesella dallaii]|uniref:Uncharacterized protein n=1 Tax=Orchesella dallaii TaxID=48710 RepID=A0ABP1S9I8_9HEXA